MGLLFSSVLLEKILNFFVFVFFLKSIFFVIVCIYRIIWWKWFWFLFVNKKCYLWFFTLFFAEKDFGSSSWFVNKNVILIYHSFVCFNGNRWRFSPLENGVPEKRSSWCTLSMCYSTEICHFLYPWKIAIWGKIVAFEGLNFDSWFDLSLFPKMAFGTPLRQSFCQNGSFPQNGFAYRKVCENVKNIVTLSLIVHCFISVFWKPSDLLKSLSEINAV